MSVLVVSPGVRLCVFIGLNRCNNSHRRRLARTKCQGKHKAMSKRFSVYLDVDVVDNSKQSKPRAPDHHKAPPICTHSRW